MQLTPTLLTLLTTTLSLISQVQPAHAQSTETSAVAFTTFSKSLNCVEINQSWQNSYIADGVCASLPGGRLRINRITDTCRVFMYKNKDCTGEEKQLREPSCYKSADYYTIKAFCH